MAKYMQLWTFWEPQNPIKTASSKYINTKIFFACPPTRLRIFIFHNIDNEKGKKKVLPYKLSGYADTLTWHKIVSSSGGW